MFSLDQAIQLMRLAANAAPMVTAIYQAAKELLGETDQEALKAAYDREFANATAMHNELQSEPVQP